LFSAIEKKRRYQDSRILGLVSGYQESWKGITTFSSSGKDSYPLSYKFKYGQAESYHPENLINPNQSLLARL